MKKTLLKIHLDKIYTFNTITNKKTIEEYLNHIFAKSIIIQNKKIISIFGIKNTKHKYWLILDSNYNLIGLNQEPDKVLILCYVNVNKMINEIKKYKEKELLDTINSYYTTYIPKNKNNNKIISEILKNELLKIEKREQDIKKDNIISSKPSINVEKIITSQVAELQTKKEKNKKVTQLVEIKKEPPKEKQKTKKEEKIILTQPKKDTKKEEIKKTIIKEPIKKEKITTKVVKAIKKIITLPKKENNKQEIKKVLTIKKEKKEVSKPLVKKVVKEKKIKRVKENIIPIIKETKKTIPLTKPLEKEVKKKSIISTILKPKKGEPTKTITAPKKVITKEKKETLKEVKLPKYEKTNTLKEPKKEIKVPKIEQPIIESPKDIKLPKQEKTIAIKEPKKEVIVLKRLEKEEQIKEEPKKIITAPVIEPKKEEKKITIPPKEQKKEEKKPEEKKEVSKNVIKKEETIPKSKPQKIYYFVKLKNDHPEVTIVQKNKKKEEKESKETKEKTISKPITKKENKPKPVYNPSYDISPDDYSTYTENIEPITNNNNNNNEPKDQSIIYIVESPTGEILYKKKLINVQPLTVVDLLLQSGLEIVQTKGFINSINGIQNEGMSGWVFEVNNAPIMVPASEYIINPTDQITWKYVDFSKMMQEENENIKEEENVSRKHPR